MNIFDDISQSIGNTPLVKLNKLTDSEKNFGTSCQKIFLGIFGLARPTLARLPTDLDKNFGASR